MADDFAQVGVDTWLAGEPTRSGSIVDGRPGIKHIRANYRRVAADLAELPASPTGSNLELAIKGRRNACTLFATRAIKGAG